MVDSLENNIFTYSDAKGLYILRLNEIIRFEAKGVYTIIFLIDDSQQVCTKNIGAIDKFLLKKEISFFLRVHKSHLVNLNYLKRYLKEDGGTIVLIDGTKIPIANRKRAALFKILSI